MCLVIIDPGSVLCGGAEDAKGMRTVMAALGKLAEDCGIAPAATRPAQRDV